MGLRLWICPVVIATMLWLDAAAQDQFVSRGDIEDYMPDYFWTLDSAHHGISDNPHRLYATLHNVNLDLVSGPAYTNGIAGSLQFSGDPSSYAEITNTGGVLASNESFAWAMLLQADSLAGQGVILEYWDGSGGLRIQQSGTDILVEAQDTADNTYNFTVSDFFTDLQWKFFALTYINFPPTIPKSVEGNKFRYFYGTFDTDKPDYDKNDDIYVTEGTVLRGTGNVRLGASYNLSVPAFSGRMACLRYHSLYIMKFDRDASYPLTCDPGGVLQTSLETLSENTVDYVPTTVISTVMTTPVVTTAEETTQQTTREHPTTVAETSAVPETTTVSQTTHSQTTESKTTLSGTTESGTTKSQTTESQTTQSETTESQTTHSESTDGQTTPNETTETQTTQSESTESQTTKKQTTESQTTHSETTKSQTAAKETTEGQRSTERQTTQNQAVKTQPAQSQTTRSQKTLQTTHSQTADLQTAEGQTTSPAVTDTTTLSGIVTTDTNSMGRTSSGPKQPGGKTSSQETSSTAQTTQAAKTSSGSSSVSPPYMATQACYTMKREAATTISPASVLQEVTVHSLSACVGACDMHAGCVAVAVEKAMLQDFLQMGSCKLAGTGFVSQADPGFYLFRFGV